MSATGQPVSREREIPYGWKATTRAVPRGHFRWSDLWRAPLHDFPIRDEILYQFLPLSTEMDVLEIGPGSGFTAFRLARRVRRLTLVDAAAEALAAVRAELKELPNVRFVCADVAGPGLPRRLQEDYDAVFGLDVLEYVVDPGACLRNLADVLRPGGELLLSFPNVPPPEGDGVTYFSDLSEMDRLLEQAAFRSWRICAVRLNPWASAVHSVLHARPLALYRSLRNGDRSARPQIYDATWAFQHRAGLERCKVVLHFFWFLLERAMRLWGSVFQIERGEEQILGRQLVILARR